MYSFKNIFHSKQARCGVPAFFESADDWIVRVRMTPGQEGAFFYAILDTVGGLCYNFFEE
jgi:hypothetical protein